MAATRELQSAHLNASALVNTGLCRLVGIMFTTAGGALSHIKIYDNTSASGTVKLELDTSKQGIVNWNIPDGGLIFSTGMYCDIGGATSVTLLIGQ